MYRIYDLERDKALTEPAKSRLDFIRYVQRLNEMTGRTRYVLQRQNEDLDWETLSL